MPQSWSHKEKGTLIECIGGGPAQGMRLRTPQPFDQSVPFEGGHVYDLARNHPGYQYEWCYVYRKAST